MRKTSGFFSVILILTILLFPLSLGGCEKNDLLSSSVSELRRDIFYGESQNYSVKASYGFREKPYVNDGKVGALENALVFKLLNKETDEATYTVVLELDGKTYSADFSRNPMLDSVTATLIVDEFSLKTFTVTVKSAAESEKVTLTSLLPENTIGYEDALSALESEQSELIKSYTDADGNFTAEIYMRVIVKDEKPYYYVGFASGNDKLKALLVDGVTGKTLAIREIF